MFVRYAVAVAVAVGFVFVVSFSAWAQRSWDITLPVGNGDRQLGLDDQPNANCFGPEAIAFDPRGDLLVLDTQNHRILRVKSTGHISVAILLPEEIGRTIDLLGASDGVYLADADHNAVVAVRNDGSIAATSVVDVGHPIEQGSLSISTGKVRLIGPQEGIAELDASLLGMLSTPSQEAAAALSIERRNATSITFVGRGGSFSLSSRDQILAATPLNLGAQGFVALVKQSRQTGERDAYYSRVVRWPGTGAPADDAFPPPHRSSCAPNRKVAVAADGTTIFFGVLRDGNAVQIRSAVFRAVGRDPILVPDDVTVTVRAAADVFNLLEEVNGVDPTVAIAAPTKKVTRDEILDRAHEALNHSWTVVPGNLQNPRILPVCHSGTSRWALPEYLVGKLGQTVSSIPYNWGGYFGELSVFNREQPRGRLAGDVCTCRDAEHYCIQRLERPIGLDCSGFVSYAWKLDNYHTTRGLPAVSKNVSWNELKAGDMLLKPGSHVMLVEKVDRSTWDPTITIIHASKACGRVCRAMLLESTLREEEYTPRERLNLTAGPISFIDR